MPVITGSYKLLVGFLPPPPPIRFTYFSKQNLDRMREGVDLC